MLERERGTRACQPGAQRRPAGAQAPADGVRAARQVGGRRIHAEERA